MSLTHKNSYGSTINSFSYALDAVGNRTARSAFGNKAAYGYDAIYRLFSAVYSNCQTKMQELRGHHTDFFDVYLKKDAGSIAKRNTWESGKEEEGSEIGMVSPNLKHVKFYEGMLRWIFNQHLQKVGFMHRALIAVVVLISSGVYTGTLFNGFVFDDNYQILKNPWITEPGHIKDIFFSSVWSFEKGSSGSNFYRPVMHLVYMAEYYMFGLAPGWFHLVNVIIHSANAVLVFLLASALLPRDAGCKDRGLFQSPSGLFPFLVATVFALHPVNTEAVAWLACVPELTYTMFYLLAFLFYLKSGKDGTTNDDVRMARKPLLFSALFFFLAALSKETALQLPVVIAAYDYMGSGGSLKDLRKRIKYYIPYGIVITIYFILRFNAIGAMAPRESKHIYLSTSQYVLNLFPLFLQQLKALLVPINLTVFHVFHPVFHLFEARTLISVAITAVVLLVFMSILRKDRFLFFFLCLIIIPLIPALYIPALGRNAFAERYLYMPSIGFALAFVLILQRFASRVKRNTGILALVTIFIAVVPLYSYKTVTRTIEYKDDYTLWKKAVEDEPANYYAMNELGGVYLQHKLYDRAIAVLKEAAGINSQRRAPDRRTLGRSYYSLATAYRFKLSEENDEDLKKRLSEPVIANYRNALEVFKNSFDLKVVYNDLGGFYMGMGLWGEALTNYEAASALSPDDEIILYNLRIARKMTLNKTSK